MNAPPPPKICYIVTTHASCPSLSSVWPKPSPKPKAPPKKLYFLLKKGLAPVCRPSSVCRKYPPSTTHLALVERGPDPVQGLREDVEEGEADAGDGAYGRGGWMDGWVVD